MADEIIITQLTARIAQAEAEISRLSTALAARIPTEPNTLRAKSMMDVKAYNKLETFDGTGGTNKWIKWRKCLFSIFKQAYPNMDVDRLCMGIMTSATSSHLDIFNAAYREPDGSYKDGVDESCLPSESYMRLMDADVNTSLNFILKDEPQDIHDNSVGGLDSLWRLNDRYFKQTRPNKLNDLRFIMNPEQAKTTSEILQKIEVWEERMKRLPEKERPTEDMKMELLSKICTKSVAKHIELHLYDCSSYAKMKQEVARLVDSGSFGGQTSESHRKKDDGVKPMEIDYMTEEQLASVIQAFMKGGKGKGKGKGNGKNSYSFNNSWNGKAGSAGKGGTKGNTKGGPTTGKGSGGGVKGKGKGQLFDGYCNACWQYGHTTRYCPFYSSGAGTNSLEEEEKHEESEKSSEEEPEQDVTPGASDGDDGYFAYLGHLNSCISPPSACTVSPRPSRATGAAKPPQNMSYMQVVSKNMHHPSNMPLKSCLKSCCHSDTSRVWKTQAAKPLETPVSIRAAKPFDPISYTGQFHALIDEEDEEFDNENFGDSLASFTSLNEITQSNIKNSKRANTRQKITVIGDSGAADCVMPESLVPCVPPNVNTEKYGTQYATAAKGGVVKNEGSKTLVIDTGAGGAKKMEFQIADVRNPLGSFRKMAEKGNRIVIDHEGNSVGYIENKKTKDRIPLRIDSGVYVFDIFVDLNKSMQCNSQVGNRDGQAVASSYGDGQAVAAGQSASSGSGFRRPGAF